MIRLFILVVALFGLFESFTKLDSGGMYPLIFIVCLFSVFIIISKWLGLSKSKEGSYSSSDSSYFTGSGGDDFGGGDGGGD